MIELQPARTLVTIAICLVVSTSRLFGQASEYVPVPGNVLDPSSPIELRQMIPTHLGFREGFNYGIGYELFLNVKQTILALSVRGLAGYSFVNNEGFLHSK